jgi:hypothetical protein
VTSPSLATTRLDGPAPEAEVARDMLRRALPVAPVLILLASIPWGVDGAVSAAYAVLLVCLNFALAAALLGWAARISLGFLMGAALFGYLLRLALLFAAVVLVKDAGWVNLWALGITLLVTHLGLLFWETRYVSASLAFPGLKPTVGSTSTDNDNKD